MHIECVCCNLICLSVVTISMQWFCYEYSPPGGSARLPPAGRSHRALCSDLLWSHLWTSREKKKSVHARQPTSLIFHLTHPGQHNTFCSLTLLTLVVGVEGSTSTPVQCVRRPVFKAWIVYWNPVVTAVQAHAAKKKKKKKPRGFGLRVLFS